MDRALIWEDVTSSNLAAVAYDKDRQRLWIRFNSGGVGYYSDVPATAYRQLMAAHSHGEFHNKFFVGTYTWHKAGAR